MNIAPIVFFDMAATIFILAISLIVIVVYLSRIAKNNSSFDVKEENFQKNEKILDETRIKAARILDDANSKALDIINKVTLSTDLSSDNFSQGLLRVSSEQIKEFEKVTSDFTKVYSQTLQDLRSKNIEIFQNTSKDIELNASEELKNFKESMDKLTSQSQGEVEKKIDTDYQSAKGEIENYKKEQLEKIDSDIYELLEKISKTILGKTISLSDHEDLIEKSLEKAKKEIGFK